MAKAQIMIVEDEELVGMAIQDYLESVGYSVPLLANSADQALRGFKDFEPDLVLMDIHLKGSMSGIEAANIIKESYHVPVIYLTAYSDPATLEFAKDTEPYGYLVKPFDERSLQATIEMALRTAEIRKKKDTSKDQLETILCSLGDGIVVAGLTGLVEFINPAAETILGLTAPLPVRTSLFALIKPLDSETGEALPLGFDKAVLERTEHRLPRCRLEGTDGMARELDLRIEPRKDERGVIRGALISLRPLP